MLRGLKTLTPLYLSPTSHLLPAPSPILPPQSPLEQTGDGHFPGIASFLISNLSQTGPSGAFMDLPLAFQDRTRFMIHREASGKEAQI